MATEVILNVGNRSTDAVTVNSVSGSSPGPYTVTLSASVPSTTVIGDKLVDSAGNHYRITAKSGSDLTCHKYPFNPGSDPATGAGTTRRAYSTADYSQPFDTIRAAMPSNNLVTADEQWTIQVGNEAELYNERFDLGFFTLTTDSTRYVKLQPIPGHGFKDHASATSNPLRYDASKGAAMRSDGDGPTCAGTIAVMTTKAVVIGMQLKATAGGVNGRSYCVETASVDCEFRDCIVESTGDISVFRGGGSGGGKIINCACIGNTGSTNATLMAGTDKWMEVYDSTIVIFGAATGAAVHGVTSSMVLKNCLVYSVSGDACAGSFSGGSNYNASDDTTTPGANSLDNLTIGDMLESVSSYGAHDLRPKSATLQAGTRNQTYTNDLDIIGQSRSTTTPTIGAWEVVAGGASAVPLLMQHYN